MKQAHRVITNGRLSGVKTPYSLEFKERATSEGFVWIGMYGYWREDDRLLITGEPVTPDDMGRAIQAKREELVILASDYFELGNDEIL